MFHYKFLWKIMLFRISYPCRPIYRIHNKYKGNKFWRILNFQRYYFVLLCWWIWWYNAFVVLFDVTMHLPSSLFYQWWEKKNFAKLQKAAKLLVWPWHYSWKECCILISSIDWSKVSFSFTFIMLVFASIILR